MSFRETVGNRVKFEGLRKKKIPENQPFELTFFAIADFGSEIYLIGVLVKLIRFLVTGAVVFCRLLSL